MSPAEDSIQTPQRRVVITGAEGLLGFHLRALLHGRDDFEIRPVDRPRFHAARDFLEDLEDANAVVHLAGMNRGEDKDLEATNVDLARTLVGHLEALESSAHLLFASTTHRDRDTAYGRSKRRAGEIFARWSAAGRGAYTEMVLPNVFGEHGRPHHNSAVSTFCHQLANGEQPTVLVDQTLDWLHAQEVARILVEAIERRLAGEPVPGEQIVAGTPLAVSELLARLQRIDRLYRQHLLPDTRDPLERDLFNTYRSYIPLARFPVALETHQDPRGRLVEAVKTEGCGQCYFSTTHPGITRGEHFHRHKFERFLVVEGTARIRVRRLFSTEVTELISSGDRPGFVDMPTFHVHDLTNVGDDTLVTLFWADEIFDPARADTQRESVAPGTAAS